MTDKDKLCREIAERHSLLQSDFSDYGLPETSPNVMAALREAYDKGHDAGAREQRKKDANVAETLDHRGCVLLAECHNAIAAAIRAGRE